ncbi:hypothetical protein ACO0K9_21800 [Undibacterium sp. Ji50W]|uniref:hypothetical protein n=1 Tax=Undibacterium sp. Ji50W TaxID=3413041 RepID=UPI003BF0AA6D
MEKHEKVARTHRVLAILYGLLLAVFGFLLYPHSGLPSGGLIGVALLFLGLTVLHYATSVGASNKKPWARMLSTLIALLMLFAFPVGTIIGAYLLFNNWSDDGYYEAT